MYENPLVVTNPQISRLQCSRSCTVSLGTHNSRLALRYSSTCSAVGEILRLVIRTGKLASILRRFSLIRLRRNLFNNLVCVSLSSLRFLRFASECRGSQGPTNILLAILQRKSCSVGRQICENGVIAPLETSVTWTAISEPEGSEKSGTDVNFDLTQVSMELRILSNSMRFLNTKYGRTCAAGDHSWTKACHGW